MKRWNTNNHIVTDTLKLFELAGMISVDRKRNWMVITICNYEKYQFAALKAQSMMKEGDNFDDIMTQANGQNLLPSVQPGMQDSDDFQLQNQLPNEKDNNINNLNNISSIQKFQTTCFIIFIVFKYIIITIIKWRKIITFF